MISLVQVLKNASLEGDSKAEVIVDCWRKEVDERTEWSYMTATLYGFGIVTTLGKLNKIDDRKATFSLGS
jgi:hypothetical protein